MKVLKEILQKFSNLDFVDIYKIVQTYGLEVIEYDLGDIDGMLFGKFIGVKKTDLKTQRFIVAHEFCHFLLREKSFSTGIYHSLDFKEKRADKFATDILLPKETLLEAYNTHQNIPTLSDIFCVPIKVIEMRLQTLLIN